MTARTVSYMSTRKRATTDMKEAFEWLSRKLDMDGALMAIVENVLEYADGMSGDEQYDFLLKMLDGVIWLTEDEICSLCWN